MKSVSYALAAGLVFAAFVAIVPHRGIADPKPTAAIVDTKEFAYTPDSVTINVGDTVLFKNSDSVGHTVAADDKTFDSGDMPTGATFTHTFDKPGTYVYFCAYHRFMHAEIVVK